MLVPCASALPLWSCSEILSAEIFPYADRRPTTTDDLMLVLDEEAECGTSDEPLSALPCSPFRLSGRVVGLFGRRARTEQGRLSFWSGLLWGRVVPNVSTKVGTMFVVNGNTCPSLGLYSPRAPVRVVSLVRSNWQSLSSTRPSALTTAANDEQLNGAA